MTKTQKYTLIGAGLVALILILVAIVMAASGGDPTIAASAGAAATAAAAAAARQRKAVTDQITATDGAIEGVAGNLKKNQEDAGEKMKENERQIADLSDEDKVTLGNKLLGPDEWEG